MKIPCKTDKCLLYPACMSKQFINCLLLFEWIITHGHSKNTWDYMRRCLINVRTVKGRYDNVAYEGMYSREKRTI